MAFIGKNGKISHDALSTNGVKHSSELNPSQKPSGQGLVMISSDAERTMCTNLGINSEISSKNVNEEVIKNSNYLLLEGYLIASPGGYEAFKKAVELAKEHNTNCLLYTSPSPRDGLLSRMPSSA